MPDWRAEARRAATRHGLDPHVFERQMGVESIDFSPAVIYGRQRSPAGALGIAQIMPATARAWGVNPLHPRQALDKAAQVMAGYVQKYGYEGALRAYNAGEGAIKASHGYAETNKYVHEILHGVSPSPVRNVAGGGSGGSSLGASQAGGGAARGTNLGQGTNIAATLAAALQSSQQQGPTVSAPAVPKFAAQPTMASPSPQAGVVPAAQVAQRQSIQGLLAQVQSSVDTSQGASSSGGGGAGGGAGAAVAAGGRGAMAGPAAIRPHGHWGGAEGPTVALFKQLGKPLGLQVTSNKRHNTNPYSGSRSDHDYGNKNAYAIDASNGSAPTPQMDEYAYRLMHALGFKDYRKGTPINTSQGVKTINGLKFQVIYRGSGEAFGGNHLNHVHLGVHRVG